MLRVDQNKQIEKEMIMNQEIFQNLGQDFFEKIENKNKENGHRLMVLFSGVPCSGKTELAKKIEDEFGGMLISKDMARNLIYKYKKGVGVEEVEVILDEYMETVVSRAADLKNGLVIHDASIDRKYEKYNDWAEKYGYEIFVIRMDTSRELVIKNIEAKLANDEGTKKWYYKQLDRWFADFENYKGRVDFEIKDLDTSQIEGLMGKLSRINY